MNERALYGGKQGGAVGRDRQPFKTAVRYAADRVAICLQRGIGVEILAQARQRDVDDRHVHEVHEVGDEQYGQRHPAARIGFGLRLRHVKL